MPADPVEFPKQETLVVVTVAASMIGSVMAKDLRAEHPLLSVMVTV